ncbi:MAG: type II secretion system protein [Deltaproteobacteria bacterium]|nr:MAG: type II secretion system protein [Deltaproteobacteria bacterium]
MEHWRAGVLERSDKARKDQYSNIPLLHCSKGARGFTLLEVMIALAIIAITLVTLLASQSQSLSLAIEAKFNTTAALLAQSKMAEIETESMENLSSDSGDFGEDFPNYHWEYTVGDLSLAGVEEALDFLKQIDLAVYWGNSGEYEYKLRLYRFVPKIK